MNVLAIFGYSGGVVTLLGAVIVIGRGIFRQTNAIEDNTEAITDLNKKISRLQEMINSHDTRLAVLEDRRKRALRRSRETSVED